MIKYIVIRDFRGTCSSVGMLKGYMVNERLGTPALEGQYRHFRLKLLIIATLSPPFHHILNIRLNQGL